jgi:hypothetical protein
MAQRRVKERRKQSGDFRVDVKRREFEQLRHLMLRLTERVSELQRQVDDLRKKMRD